MIHVCPLSALGDIQQQRRPLHLVSLLSPGHDLDVELAADIKVLTLRFHDIAVATPDLIAPDRMAIERLIGFSRDWRPDTPMLIHCFAGISRSSAAAFIMACEKKPGHEYNIARELRQRAPFATPNRLMVAIADDVLGRGGRMVDAIAAIGRGADAFEGTPYELPVV